MTDKAQIPGKSNPQDMEKVPNQISEVLRTLRQEATPFEYKAQLLNQLEKPYSESGFEQASKDKCEQVYVFGDVHAQCESVATALEAIEASCAADKTSLSAELIIGRIAILFVGDLVHSENKTENFNDLQNDEVKKKIAESNLNTVLGITLLKSMYPDSVFVVSGNHDASATKPNILKKNGIDQGELLNSILSPKDCSVPLQTLLDRLPLMFGLHIKDKHIVMSHALPLPEIELKELLTRLNASESTLSLAQEYINEIWGNSREKAIEKIVNRVYATAETLRWGKLNTFLRFYNSDEIKDNKGMKSKVWKLTQDYISLLMKRIFFTLSSGAKVKPSDVLWLVGHESTEAGSRNIVQSLNSSLLTEQGTKIIQVNGETNLSVLSLNLKDWDKDGFISKDRVRLF